MLFLLTKPLVEAGLALETVELDRSRLELESETVLLAGAFLVEAETLAAEETVGLANLELFFTLSAETPGDGFAFIPFFFTASSPDLSTRASIVLELASFLSP